MKTKKYERFRPDGCTEMVTDINNTEIYYNPKIWYAIVYTGQSNEKFFDIREDNYSAMMDTVYRNLNKIINRATTGIIQKKRRKRTFYKSISGGQYDWKRKH